MTETEFIELALRYLDRAACPAEVERLGAAILAEPQLGRLYRELVQQAQLAHEWHQVAATPTGARIIGRLPPRRRAATLAAAAAAILLLLFVVNRHEEPPLPPAPAPARSALATSAPPPDFFAGDPSWTDIYPSPFDYPEFVWRAEFPAESTATGLPDEFSDNWIPPLVAASPAGEFSRLLEPIALLPGGEASATGFD